MLNFTFLNLMNEFFELDSISFIILFKFLFLEHYKGDGSYAIFAGKDCSVSLAKMSFDQSYLNSQDFASLSLQENDVLTEWHAKFIQKYPIVGKLKK